MNFSQKLIYSAIVFFAFSFGLFMGATTNNIISVAMLMITFSMLWGGVVMIMYIGGKK